MLEWRISRSKKEVTREGKKQHKDEFYNLHSSQNNNYVDQMKEDEMGDSYCMHGIDGNCIWHFGQ
jgi:hypothetical protein